MVLWIGTGSIFYLALLLSRFTGEKLIDKTRPRNTFDRLFFMSIVMSLLVFAITVRFFQAGYTSQPLTVGILAGLMRLPLSWIIDHWVGTFHPVARTVAYTSAFSR